MRIDNTVIMSDYFQFYLIDLESIMPDVLNRYHDMLAKLYAKCDALGDGWAVKVDSVYNLVKGSVGWGCGLYIESGDVKLLGKREM